MTLDLTTHFLARGQAGIAARCPCRAGQADPRPRLPAGRGQAERRELLQLQRHAQAGEPAQRTVVAMTDPFGSPTTQLIAADELKPDAAQARAVAALDRLQRASRSRRIPLRACSARERRRPGRRLPLGRGRARQVDADGPRLRRTSTSSPSGASTSTRSCSKPTSGCARRASARKAIRSNPSPSRSPPKRSCCASTRCRSPTRPTR